MIRHQFWEQTELVGWMADWYPRHYSNLCLLPAPSSWTSSAPAASPSPPFSPTPRPSSSAPVARPSSASPPVARPVSLRAALSAESRCHDTPGWSDDERHVAFFDGLI
ncbi:unnamed protein product [Aspergillus oryzae]|uniref:Unnamed protein product n=2 Tax=Aspergillus oryzae TaxID=5062 RepID=A0AAN5BRS5_ASPOZ|nr:unnamed protein product [Aspergillus oryzae]GMF86474.1 unnamed protein product [Aspergillus oryzae]GMG04035.1 unnamed protein product [Aspergillus oryzae]GMG29405.1 unnamed protein product [Aspergillus oryzae]GMG40856.1 unnamed protein product [Aspergillus oryzae var. brunneus]